MTSNGSLTEYCADNYQQQSPSPPHLQPPLAVTVTTPRFAIRRKRKAMVRGACAKLVETQLVPKAWVNDECIFCEQ